MSMAGVGREQAVVAQEMASRAGDEGGESGDEVQGLKQYVGGTVGVRMLELVDDEAVAVDAQALEGDGGSQEIAGIRLGATNKVQSPSTKRSSDERFGARCRLRLRTSNCSFMRRFSATSPRTPPGPASRASTATRWIKRTRRPFIKARNRVQRLSQQVS